MYPDRSVSRREWLWRTGGGLGGIALAAMEAQGKTHFPAKAKRALCIFMPGGVSHMDTFEYKPELARHHGKETKGANTITPFFGKRGALMKSPWTFRPHGQSGKWVSEILPHLAGCVDDMTFVHSMTARSNTHGPALFQMSTGSIFQGFPSIGSWISYGLGSENENLPAFVSLPDSRGMPPGGPVHWGNGFLPAAHQGVIFSGEKEPVADLAPPAGVSGGAQEATLRLLGELNRGHLRMTGGEDALDARIKAYELAARMQLSAPEATSISGESDKTREEYGFGDAEMRPYAFNCLLARRLLERGVRCVHLYNGAHFGAPRVNWDAHENIEINHGKLARVFDQPTAALLRDMKRRGMLDDTVVMCTTEFGRLPITQGLGEGGRDHNPEGFTSWLAGAGLKRGFSFGATDELGYKAAVDPVTIYDFHATILHLMGLDHTRLSYYHNGLQRRLTDVHGHVIQELLA